MGYASLRAAVDDLERHGHLRRIDVEIDPYLEAAEIHRRVYRGRGPALYFSRVKGSAFPMASNLFGTIERARFLFRDSIESVRRLIELKVDPGAWMKRPFRYAGVPFTLLRSLPKRVTGGAVFDGQTSIGQLPQLVCWPRDGGAFITLPQVYTEDPDRPGVMHSNLGMYRVQLGGNAFAADKEVGLHYQIHRGIGVHHAAALRRSEPLAVNVFVGGPPAMTLAAVMPLPQGVTELAFAGALGGRRIRMARQRQPDLLPVHADADFALVGSVIPGVTKPEGPFGDHLGYYSLTHDFPVMRVTRVYHRAGAIWPFTVVGRPPQEDTAFGALIHDLTGPVIPTVLPGVTQVHAVDAAGVHPLLLAMGSERYVPYQEDDSEPRELLTQASAILGQGQLSLAKYLFIGVAADDPDLHLENVSAALTHVLARFDPTRDLHFHTNTNMDTLDYTGGSLNRGSKLVVAARGKVRRSLPSVFPQGLRLSDGFTNPKVCLPGVLALQGSEFIPGPDGVAADFVRFCAMVSPDDPINAFPLIVVVDDSDFAARSVDNFVWVTFTRSNPAVDVGGIGAGVVHKHWGCRGAVVIDARRKPQHAPPLEEDPVVTARVDKLFAHGGPLHGFDG